MLLFYFYVTSLLEADLPQTAEVQSQHSRDNKPDSTKVHQRPLCSNANSHPIAHKSNNVVYQSSLDNWHSADHSLCIGPFLLKVGSNGSAVMVEINTIPSVISCSFSFTVSFRSTSQEH